MKRHEVDTNTLERIKISAQRIAEFTGVNVEKVEYLRESGSMVLRVVIDKEGGVTTGDCAAVSRALSKKLDEMDIIKEHYLLEVSSPGILGHDARQEA